jgi:DMSO reductase family type II enzyme chaperone
MTSTESAQAERAAWLAESAAAWGFLHDLFRAPGPVQWDWLRSDAAQQAWSILAAACAPDLPRVMPLAERREDYEQEFLAIFEVGLPHPPCPLIETHWNKSDATPRILHEHILFYRQFGLELRATANETADHLRHQLEFLHYLCRREAAALAAGTPEAADQFARGRRDYLARHPARWIAPAAESLRQAWPESWAREWPAAWMSLLAAFSGQAAACETVD